MKFSRLLFLLPVFFLLASCSDSFDEKGALTDELKAVTHASYVVKTEVSFPEKEASFTVSYSHSPEVDRASVITPREIAGVSYTISGEDASLEFDGARLSLGKLTTDSLSPFSAVHTLIDVWKAGDFEETSPTTIFGKRAILAISREDKDAFQYEYRTWFSKDEYLPLYAEIFSDGERIIKCEFERSEHNK